MCRVDALRYDRGRRVDGDAVSPMHVSVSACCSSSEYIARYEHAAHVAEHSVHVLEAPGSTYASAAKRCYDDESCQQ